MRRARFRYRGCCSGGPGSSAGFPAARWKNTHCCGASIDHLLIGLDTDTDAIRIHIRTLTASRTWPVILTPPRLYDATRHTGGSPRPNAVLKAEVNGTSPDVTDGMGRLISRLLVNKTVSQIEYVRSNFTALALPGHRPCRALYRQPASCSRGDPAAQSDVFLPDLKTVEEALPDLM